MRSSTGRVSKSPVKPSIMTWSTLIVQGVMLVGIVSLLFWGWQLESNAILMICLLVIWRYFLLLVVVWRRDIIPEIVIEPLAYYTKHRWIVLLLLWMLWMILTGTYDMMLLFGVNVWISLIWWHWSSISKGELYRWEQRFGRDEWILAVTLLVMISLPRLVWFLPSHHVYVVSATYGVVAFSLGHLRWNQRSKDFFKLMSFWGLVVLWVVSVWWFLTKERMIVMEHRIVEKEVVVQRVQYVPMELWTGSVIPLIKDTKK